MDIKQVLYFWEIANSGNYSAAAKSLSVTQPTLSMAIQKLEKEFGVTLFSYSGRKVRLTSEGRQLYGYVRDFIGPYNKMLFNMSNIKKEVSGSITIIAAPIMSQIYLGELLSLFHNNYPDVSIHIEGKYGDASLKYLDTQEIDFAMKMLPVDEEKYSIIPIAKQKLRLGVPKNHPLASQKQVSFRKLSNEKFLTLSDDYSLHKQFMRNCEKAGFIPNIVLSASDCSLLANMVSREWGVFLTAQPIWDSVDTSNIHLLDINDADTSWDLALIRKKERMMNTASIVFASMAEEFFKTNK